MNDVGDYCGAVVCGRRHLERWWWWWGGLTSTTKDDRLIIACHENYMSILSILVLNMQQQWLWFNESIQLTSWWWYRLVSSRRCIGLTLWGQKYAPTLKFSKTNSQPGNGTVTIQLIPTVMIHYSPSHDILIIHCNWGIVWTCAWKWHVMVHPQPAVNLIWFGNGINMRMGIWTIRAQHWLIGTIHVNAPSRSGGDSWQVHWGQTRPVNNEHIVKILNENWFP